MNNRISSHDDFRFSLWDGPARPRLIRGVYVGGVEVQGLTALTIEYRTDIKTRGNTFAPLKTLGEMQISMTIERNQHDT